MMFVYDRKYNRTAFLSNDAEDGIHFEDDRLTTSIETAMYSLDLKIPKDTPLAGNIDVGYYIETYTRHNKQLLLAITDIDETGEMIDVYCEDSSILALNSFVDAIEPPRTKEMADYYLNHALEKVDLEILVNECDTEIMLEFGTRQRVLQRIMEIAKAFDMEVSFDVEFSPGSSPKRYVSLLKKRVEDYQGFRVSSDDALYEIQRKTNMNNVFTKMLVIGKQQTPVTPEGGDGGGGSGGTTNPIGQPPATQYDSSKSSGATAISTNGWNLSEVNEFRMDAADPPYVTGAYIDTFLKNYYPDSPLIGAGSLIKEMSDYFGVSIGAAMGVWAKETTFGRGEPGKSHYNYGCIRWTPNSLFTPVTYGGSQWDFYPNQRTGIAAWFRLARYVYIDKGLARYEDFLNLYSPTSENDQATFKNLMWGTLKSFGYNMSATTVKTNYSKSTDSVINLQVPKSTSLGTPNEPEVDSFVEKAIDRAFEIQPLKLRYQWGGNGNPSYDCSGFMQECFRAAGKTIDHRWTTYTMWAQQGGHFRRISKSELKRGDMVLYDTGYTTPGDVNHVGLYLGPTMSSPNSIIHAGDPVGITQRADSMTVIGYVRVVR